MNFLLQLIRKLISRNLFNLNERETRVELAAYSLEGYRSTN